MSTLIRIKSLLLENKNARQTFTKNVFWLSVANIANRLIRAALIIYAARALGVAGYGIFSYAVSLAAFFSIFSDMGVSALITKEASRDASFLRKYFATALYIKIILIVISAVAIIFIAPLFSNIKEAIPLLPLAALLIAFDGMRDLSFAITRAWEKMQLEAGIGIVTNIAITVLGLLALFFMPDPQTFLLWYALGSGVGTFFAAWVLRAQLREITYYFNLHTAKKIIFEALPFSIMGLLGTIMLNTDAVILGYFSSATELGLYSAGQKIVFLLYAMPTILSSTIFPSMTRLAKENAERFGNVLETALIATFLISIPMFLGGVVLSKEIIHFLFGAAYQGAVVTFGIMLFTVILIFPQTFLTNGIFAFNGQKKFITLTLIGVIGNVILDLLLIPRFGIAGSATATVVVGTIVTFLMWQQMKIYTRFFPLRHLKKIALSAGVMLVSVLLLKTLNVNVLVNIVSSSLVYFGVLFFLKEKILEEFLLPLRRLLKK